MTLVFVFAAVIYLYFMFLGWGLARMLLPPALNIYRTWFAPWMGLMMAAVLLTWLSRLGMGTATALYPVTIAGALFAGFSVWRDHEPLPARSSFRLAFPIAFLITLSVCLYTLLSLSREPTTVSLGNNDPAVYSAMADFLKYGNVSHPPSRFDFGHPVMVNLAKVAEQRQGTFLVISVCAQLFRVQAYRIFFVLTVVMFAATTPLIGIFVEAVGGGDLAVLLALSLSVFNVNQFYDFYHGFAGQIFFQGCLTIALILMWRREDEPDHWLAYAVALGLTICGMFGIFAEGLPLLVILYALYAASQLVLRKGARWRLAQRYALPFAIAVGLDPVAAWNFVRTLIWASAIPAGWALPRWALPADIVGFTNSYNGEPSGLFAELLAAAASVPVAYFAVSGWRAWRHPRLTLSVISTPIALLLYLYGIRHYSYGYHKVATICAFLLVAGFATGLARVLQRYIGRPARVYANAAAVTLVATLSFLAVNPLIEQMKTTTMIVGNYQLDLQSIRHLAGTHPIYMADDRVWDQMWASEFLYPVVVLLNSPNYFGVPPLRFSDELILLALPNDDSIDAWSQRGMTTWWQNNSYVLMGPSSGPQPSQGEAK